MSDEKVQSISSGISVSDQEARRRFQHGEAEIEEVPGENSLHRGLKARQISMIALGGAIGTGLIIGSGTALVRGGPLGILLGYSYVGMVCYFVMVALGEMAAYLPHKKGFAGYATRFVDPAMGFALGWNYLLKYLIVTPNNINAAGAVIQYWTTKVHIAIWMVIFILFVFCINLLGVRVFGELEFWFSGIKVVTLIGLILMGLIIDLGGNPRHDRLGFRYWKAPYGPMGHYLQSAVDNEHLSIFLGFWSTLTNALFAYIGTELIGVTVGEAENPRKNIPIAIRRTFFRILIFYIGGVFVIGLIVPSTEDNLFVANKAKTGAAASPFVVATTLAGIRVLNHIINAAILLFVLSAANSDLYIGSRTLYGLAVERKAPRIFTKVNRMGVPWPALILCTLFSGLVFLNVKSASQKVFGWFVNLVSTFGAITWMCICYSHIRFMKALTAQNISRDSIPYKAPMQPFGSWLALISTAIITIFKGYDTFIPFKSDTFVTSYIALPVFCILWAGYKVIYKTSVIPILEVDLTSGMRVLDEEEKEFARVEQLKGPRTRLQRLWDNLTITVRVHSSQDHTFSENLDKMAIQSVSRSVMKKVLAIETEEGAGAMVRRSIGGMTLRNLTPFLMLDHFHISKGAGFPDHPHRGQATVTYMLEGSSRHEDSAGHAGLIKTGGVQWMCAGRGIIHAEMPVNEPGQPEPRGLQLWVDLPAKYKMVEPTYQELDPENIPSAYPAGPDGPQIKVISGKSHGVESPVRPLGGCWYLHIIFKKQGTVFQSIRKSAGWTTFVYTLKGGVKIGSDNVKHDPYYTLVLSASEGENGVTVTSTEDNTELVLIAGEPLDQEVVQYGPFVMTSREEIQKTFIDYRLAQNGFEKAHIWKSKIGGL
ncbi:hypothetical protein EW146_g7405 [Bondarzewia mesenterica]|uniref:Amino acid permease/ SLC12A domain-containing protein n=1 Tax=Bondarzewia mesenterica TaxID=1095465 RepID=A0A4S4LKV5_9AGAM|nr:hypothetical protein EW146_g7405 [Bondarzewia mesenterica]